MSDLKPCCIHDSDCAVHNAPALPVGPCDCGKTLKNLISASAMLGCLPENPGYNGSVLLIDDTKAARIEKDIDEGVRHIQDLTRQLSEVTAERDAAIRGCDSYAAENQRMSDEMDALRTDAERYKHVRNVDANKTKDGDVVLTIQRWDSPCVYETIVGPLADVAIDAARKETK